MSTPDLIIHPSWIVPIVPRGTVLENHSVCIQQGRIASIIPSDEARRRPAGEHLALPGQVLMPGLINCHGHAALSLLRGHTEKSAGLSRSLSKIGATEARALSEEFVRDGTDLALAEMILGGTTTFSDMYFFPDVTAERADLLGMRAQLCFPILMEPTAWAQDAEHYLGKGLALRDRYRDHDRIELGFGPYATYAVDEEMLARLATLANELDAPLQIHLHETRGEVQMSIEAIGERPIDQLSRIGMLGPRTQCVHMTSLSREDITVIGQAGAHVIHCPRANMKLAAGASPVQVLLDAGVNVALGTDGATGNDRLSVFAELQAAALLAKLQTEQPSALPAAVALEMATINGARALGYEQQLGSLEHGKQADMISVDLNYPGVLPVHDVISQLVYAISGTEVSHSWVAGKPLMTNRTLTELDVLDVGRRARGWRDRIADLSAHPLAEEHQRA